MIPEDLIICRQPAKASQLTGKDAHPRNYARTIYDENGKLIDDGDLREVERSYFEQFVEPDVAAELEARLDRLERGEIDPLTEPFTDMDEEEEDDYEDYSGAG